MSLALTDSHLFWDPSLDKFIPANHLKKGERLKTPNGTLATADGGTTPKVHNDWMWDLTVPGNNDHDFYVTVGATSILVHNQNAPGCGPEEFVTNALSDLAGKRVTTGRIFDSAGNPIADELEAGGSSDLVKATDAYLRQNGAPINPRATYYTASQHVEAQYAMWMRENGVTDATVVTNNAKGVCRGMYGCLGAVKVILREGQTMTV